LLSWYSVCIAVLLRSTASYLVLDVQRPFVTWVCCAAKIRAVAANSCGYVHLCLSSALLTQCKYHARLTSPHTFVAVRGVSAVHWCGPVCRHHCAAPPPLWHP
jgi:hypothetical protein